jgi:hypothetical protein
MTEDMIKFLSVLDLPVMYSNETYGNRLSVSPQYKDFADSITLSGADEQLYIRTSCPITSDAQHHHRIATYGANFLLAWRYNALNRHPRWCTGKKQYSSAHCAGVIPNELVSICSNGHLNTFMDSVLEYLDTYNLLNSEYVGSILYEEMTDMNAEINEQCTAFVNCLRIWDAACTSAKRTVNLEPTLTEEDEKMLSKVTGVSHYWTVLNDEQKDRFTKEISDRLIQIRNELGIDTILDAYFDGIDIDDLIAGNMEV